MECPLATICIASYNRYQLLERSLESIYAQNYPVQVIVVDDGSTDDTHDLVQKFPILYIYLNRPEYGNQSRPMNIAIRHSDHDIIIMQSAEVLHRGKVIEPLIQHVTGKNWVFAKVQNGDQEWYVSPEFPRPFSFCSALKREHLVKIRGLDEDFDQPGYEDNDLADRLIQGLGLDPVFTDIEVEHQPHSRPELGPAYATMAALYHSKSGTGHIRNQNREWGEL